jgi:hypothetical protein
MSDDLVSDDLVSDDLISDDLVSDDLISDDCIGDLDQDLRGGVTTASGYEGRLHQRMSEDCISISVMTGQDLPGTGHPVRDPQVLVHGRVGLVTCFMNCETGDGGSVKMQKPPSPASDCPPPPLGLFLCH